MNLLLKLSKGIDAFTDKLGGIIKLIVVLTIAATFLNAFLRYLGKAIAQTLISNELIQVQWYLFSMIFLFGFPYILLHNTNVRVDFLYAKWGPRRRAFIDFFGTLLFLIPFCLLAIYVSINPVLIAWGRLPDGTFGAWEFSSDAGGLPMAPLKTLIILGFLLLLIQAVSQLIKYLAILTGRHETDHVVMAAGATEQLAEEALHNLQPHEAHEAGASH